ncbi:hypothetical protein V6N13_016339 [Hibiscus sabdariffa]|uniref:RIN4 pathogenic type III effector avirulence factor Avr cleavage site domain-containing protein n=1 Tax=Hibiscus sabdariffa TaxID=183260 RepID=A0ABR2BJ43_9ROSI
MSEEKGRPLPKFGEWDVNDPASAEGFTVIFNKARDEKKTGGKPESPAKADPAVKPGADLSKPQPKKMVLLHSSTVCGIVIPSLMVAISIFACEGFGKDFSFHNGEFSPA